MSGVKWKPPGSKRKKTCLGHNQSLLTDFILNYIMLQTSSLLRAVLFLLLVFVVVAGFYFAKPFLIPVCFGALSAMLFLPLSRWLERKKIPKGLAILFCLVLLLSIITILVLVISWQVTDLTREVSAIENKGWVYTFGSRWNIPRIKAPMPTRPM